MIAKEIKEGDLIRPTDWLVERRVILQEVFICPAIGTDGYIDFRGDRVHIHNFEKVREITDAVDGIKDRMDGWINDFNKGKKTTLKDE